MGKVPLGLGLGSPVLQGCRDSSGGLGVRLLLERGQSPLVDLLVAQEVIAAGEALVAGAAAVGPVPCVGLEVPLQ